MSARRLVAPLPTLIAAAVSCCFTSFSAFSNPTGPTVVHGNATFVPAGPVLSITNTPNTIINWQRFSIAAGEVTRFIQQFPESAVLNRVTGAHNPSQILGALQSNGRVFLINPSGILFGPGSQVDVAGLVASSLNLSNEDFLVGRWRFTNTPGARAVSNFGGITAAQGGEVYLVGPDVTNGGIITTPRGVVLLAAGRSVELMHPTTPNLRVEIVARNNQAVNLGEIIADAGRVGIFAGLVRNSGRLQADVATWGEHGEILLRATRHVTQDAGGVLQARTFNSADEMLTAVDISAGGDIRLNGDVRAGEGRIDLTAGGNIRLESTEAGAANLSGISVSLHTTTPGKTITQAPDAQIANIDGWGGMQIVANGDVSLIGQNAVKGVFATVDRGGDMTLNNREIFDSLKLGRVVLAGGGSFVLNHKGHRLSIESDVRAGQVTINNPTGSTEISGPVSSPGPININTAGLLSLQGSRGSIVGEGLVKIATGGDLQLVGGPVLLQGQSLDLTVGGLLTLNNGIGPVNYARIQSATPIQLSFPNLSTGGYFVNGVEGVIRQGETGIFVGPNPAVPGQTLLLDYAAP